MSDEWRDPATRLADGKCCLDAALLYLSWGWSVLPLCPPDHVGVGKDHGKNCKRSNWGKAPLIAGWQQQEQLPTPAQVVGWWRHWPNANVGIALGPLSGLVGLDLDGEGGEARLWELCKGILVPTYEFRTPGGGRRLLFATGQRLFRPKFMQEAKKQEFRLLGQGAQTVAPPSRHQSGGIYEWVALPQES
jgi:hypothetical protein